MISGTAVTFNAPSSPEECLSRLERIQGKIEVYSWFEGPQGISRTGAEFLRDRLYKPLLLLKEDVKLILYSLKGWDFCNPKEASSSLGDAINKINPKVIESLTASAFFNYADESNQLQTYLGYSLIRKKWLLELSEKHKEKGFKVSSIFRGTLFSEAQNLDVSRCYSFLQYVEGYYLIQRSIRRDAKTIVFLLPNDEAKFYQDYGSELEKMLEIDLGKKVLELSVKVEFIFFKYGESLADRPYIDKSRRPDKLKPEEMASFFNFLNFRSPS